MMHIILFIAVAISSLFLSISCKAINLEDALVRCYENSEELQSANLAFGIEIEQFPQTLSQYFFPDITAQASQTLNKSRILDPKSPYFEQGRVQQSLTLNMPLFNGGGGMAALKAANEAFKVAKGKYYSAEQSIILNAIKIYLECYAAQQKLLISETSVKSNAKQLEAVQERVKLGESTNTELSAAKAALASAHAHKANAYAQFQFAKASFIKTFNIDPSNITIPKLPKNMPQSFEAFIKNLNNNPDIYKATHSLSEAKAAEWAAKSSLLPSTYLQISADKSQYDQKTPSTPDLLNVTSTVGISVPILSKGGIMHSKVRESKKRRRLAAVQFNQQLKVFNTNAVAIWENFQATIANIESTTAAADSYQIAYDGILEEELLGSKTILDVLVAEDKLNQSRVQKIDTEVAHVLYAYQIQSLVGKLTAKALQLRTKLFNPDAEFKKIKMRIVGT